MEITQEYLKSRLSYDPLTGVFVWLNGRRQGKNAGTMKPHRNGYLTVSIGIPSRKTNSAHILAWLYMTGEWPSQVIDHKNRNATDNRWKNLRIASNKVNSRNASKRSDNTSGFSGVSLDKKSGRWMAQVGTTQNGYFKNNFLGRFATPEQAMFAVQKFRQGKFDPEHGLNRTHYSKGSEQ